MNGKNKFFKDSDFDQSILEIKVPKDLIASFGFPSVIFNPGTENDTLRHLAESEGIETEEACTLVLLNLGQY